MPASKPAPDKPTVTDLSHACRTCDAQCCRYIALEWDRPRTKREYDYVRWFLLHENVCVFIDPDGKWFIEFLAPCQAIAPDGRCAIYETRPQICRDHGEGDEHDCETLGEGSPYRVRFKTSEDFERYLDQQGEDWRWKRRPRK